MGAAEDEKIGWVVLARQLKRRRTRVHRIFMPAKEITMSAATSTISSIANELEKMPERVEGRPQGPRRFPKRRPAHGQEVPGSLDRGRVRRRFRDAKIAKIF